MRLATRLSAVCVVATIMISFGPTAEAEKSTAALERALEEVAEQLGDDWVRIGTTRTGGLGEGQTVRFSHMLRKGACYRFLAVGGATAEDLDLRVFAGAKLLAEDKGKVTRPVAEFCADQDVSVEARLQLFAGTGQYAYALYAKGGADDPGRASDRERAAVAELATIAAEIAPGMETLGEPHAATLGHRNADVVPVVLDMPRCYKFVALGGPGVTDLTMSVLVDGKEVAGDRISGRRPVAQWCAPGRTHAEVKITMYGGAGAYALGVYGARSSALTSPEKVGGDQTDFIANRIRQLHAQFGKSRAAVSPVFRGNLSTNNEQVFKVRLVAGHCYTIIGAGAPSARDIDLILLDRNNSELQRDKSRNGFPTLDTDPCPRFTGEYTVKVKMIQGLGQFGAQVFSD